MGVDCALFLANKQRTFSIFGKIVTESRFNSAKDILLAKLNGWRPEFNNAFQLYVQNGKDWKKVNASEICGTLSDWHKPYDAWKTMPAGAINEVKSWPEFDAEMFKIITGIDVNKDIDKKKELLAKADELIAKANELKAQANNF
jgi:hypothetical protein